MAVDVTYSNLRLIYKSEDDGKTHAITYEKVKPNLAKGPVALLVSSLLAGGHLFKPTIDTVVGATLIVVTETTFDL